MSLVTHSSGNTNFESVSGPNCQYFEGNEQIESRSPRGGAGDDTAPFNLRPLHNTRNGDKRVIEYQSSNLFGFGTILQTMIHHSSTT